ncbi:MAG: S41 family peptidase [Gemmataceae bacterium]|nr:S41 family peptidase [Gemmataceae bacterium]
MSRWNLSWLLGITAVALVGLSLLSNAPASSSTLQSKHENLRLLVDVLEEVQNKYVKDLDKAKMRELVENMVNGGLERLDPHSSYINAEEFRQFQRQSKGKFGGVGIKIGVDRVGQLFVESPMVGTPAYEAGIMAGDIIVKIDGKSTENMSLKKAVEMIQGEPGQKVVLSVVHEGGKKPEDIPIVRAEIRVESVLGDQRHPKDIKKWDFTIDPVNKIAYVRVTAFTETTTEELGRVIDQLKKDGIQGLILDLRNNPGGLLRSAVEVSSLFLPEGKRVVSTKGRNQKEEEYDARRERNAPASVSYPIAILLNRYSASASEIVAAALQDHLRAVVIGERSYGKGSVQHIIPMENGSSALKLTTASYWRPNGKNIHRFPDSKDEDDWGVKPNDGFEVKLKDEERIDYYKWRRERDVIRRPGAPAPKPEKVEKDEKEEKVDGKKKEPFKDRVMEKALEYLRSKVRKTGAQLPQENRSAEGVPVAPAVVPVGPSRTAALEFRARPEFIGSEELR